jgi:hypothetical protein
MFSSFGNNALGDSFAFLILHWSFLWCVYDNIYFSITVHD